MVDLLYAIPQLQLRAVLTRLLKAIDDDEISCQFPHGITVFQVPCEDVRNETGSNEGETFDLFLTYVQYARLCGKIAKQLYSASAVSRPCRDMLSTATLLDEGILRWRESIPITFRPGTSFRPSTLPNNVPFIHALVLNFAYNYAICAVYRRFSAMFLHYDSQSSPTEREATEAMSAAKCLEAARSMILLTKHLDIESYSPGWYVLF